MLVCIMSMGDVLNLSFLKWSWRMLPSTLLVVHSDEVFNFVALRHQVLVGWRGVWLIYVSIWWSCRGMCTNIVALGRRGVVSGSINGGNIRCLLQRCCTRFWISQTAIAPHVIIVLDVVGGGGGGTTAFDLGNARFFAGRRDNIDYHRSL